MSPTVPAPARAPRLAAGLGLAALLAAAVLPLGIPGAARADERGPGKILVTEAISRPTPPGTGVGVVYLRMANRGDAPDRLLAVDCPLAAAAELHTTQRAAGQLQMRRLAGIDLAPGATVLLESGGAHVMLMGLRQALTVGQQFPLQLHFERAGLLTVQVRVTAPR